MANSKRTEKVSVSVHAKGVHPRALDDLEKLVTEVVGEPISRPAAAKKTAGERQRNARRRQVAAKKAASARRKAG
jgi:hypothetical protein